MDRKEFAKQALCATALFSAAPALGVASKQPSPLDEAVPSFKPLFNGKNLDGFVDVNTSEDTWWVEDGILKATGQPIGVIRTEKQYQNFILDVEWRHMEPGGNSGVFVWANGTPHEDNPYPKGMEVQMLDTQWAEIHDRPIEYVHGHLFPAMNLEGTIPDNPSEIEGRSYALENRVNATGEWNRYIVVCVDGTIKLSVNGKFVNGIRSTKRKKGYICPESEGAEVHFRKMDIMELPGGVISPDQVAPVVG
ncbi:3-keto-disaccharide hydrolase [Fodinibius salsisoli]|uniref:DUF1080 domain-containing protein n=1 Tax=Fodinibius salsisoli TaxID=2820877 RepID=A0ABT3PM51_9BACT|nr:DUF1080 domain-containing protein [Fodinibius salsisoli]MCW9707026.1 DUF1080 domain-containing protein [Fodinibius salsisoli]